MFKLTDEFDIFENPHGLEELDADDRSRLASLYKNKKHPDCHAYFAPRGSADLYYAIVGSLQYIFVRNYISGSVLMRVSLMNFPLCMSLDMAPESEGGEGVWAFVGTKEGAVQKIAINSAGPKILSQTKPGLFYGGITAIDVFRDTISVGNIKGETAIFANLEDE